jgi:hypothetical protein
MPRYFFDYVEDGRAIPDPDGGDHEDLQHARQEALCALGELAKAHLVESDHKEFQMQIRAQDGEVLLTASLSLRVDLLP